MPLRLSKPEWRALLSWFARGAPSAEIASETGLERKRVLRALKSVRQAMQHDNPAPEGEASPPLERPVLFRRRRDSVLGLYVVHGMVGIEVVSERGRPTTSRYSAIVERGKLHRLDPHGEGRGPIGHIEAFWSYLQRRLRGKGGIRSSSLALYLAEFTWRYNHRKLTTPELSHELFRLLGERSRWHQRDDPSRRNNSSGDEFWTMHLR